MQQLLPGRGMSSSRTLLVLLPFFFYRLVSSYIACGNFLHFAGDLVGSHISRGLPQTKDSLLAKELVLELLVGGGGDYRALCDGDRI